jgi:hypothetical protein
LPLDVLQSCNLPKNSLYKGVEVPDDIDGVDQWSALSTGRSSARTEIIHNIDEDKIRGLFQVGNINVYKGILMRTRADDYSR